MTLAEAIEEVKRDAIGYEYKAHEFYKVASTNVADQAIATILNAVVKGKLTQ